MAITAKAPDGGIVAELGGKSRPLLLRNGEIERFEAQHAPLGIFQFLYQLLGQVDQVTQRREYPTATHCRDIVALGLVGGGLTDMEADAVVGGLTPRDLIQVRTVARDLVMAAFAPKEDKKKDGKAGSSSKT